MFITKIFEETKLDIIKKDDNIWFRAKTVASILNYKNTCKAILNHVDSEDKITLKDLKPWGNESVPQKNDHVIYINESGLYSLILRSDMEKAKDFKRWITGDVLPSIRKTGRYEYLHKPFKMLTFNIQMERDLHKKVVNYIRNHHPKALLIASLGENQINENMRLKSYFMGYQKGSPDIIIQNQHKTYSGFAIEFKTPKGNGQLSDNQKIMLQEYKKNQNTTLLLRGKDSQLQQF